MPVPIEFTLLRLISVTVECLLYGAYIMIFGIAMWIIPRKFHVPFVRTILYPILVALFVLSTINVVYDMAVEEYAILDAGPVNNKPWMTAGVSILEISFAISDILGDLVLFYRVYAVWGYRKRILYPLLVIVLVAKVFNLAFVASVIRTMVSSKPFQLLRPISLSFSGFFLTINAFANLLMTVLIGSRVWWILKTIDSRSVSGLRRRRWLHQTIAIMTETGIIYPVYLIVEAPLPLPNCTALGIGLAPTLVAVRVGLGRAYDNQSLRTQRQTSTAVAGNANTTSDVIFSTDIAEESQFDTRDALNGAV
ncbi:hypothetical protein D9757_006972 [Collybiopsis confluens]|uniref:Uncharacterized protein n=1 Tax=Collybiopsis confluens TaxID=2823264 RepID=A0A8H5HIM3_9AGAR|nr:hypothetical protein D9757_006972 [Collybiopsis confluens]